MTPKQREIARLVSLGYNGTEIAKQLGLTKRAVHARLSRAYVLTGARSQAALVGWSVAHGVVTVEELREAYAGGARGQVG